MTATASAKSVQTKTSGKIAKLLCGALAAAALATTVMPQDAEAGWRHRRGWAVGAGVLGGLAAGALIAGAAQAHPGYYAAPSIPARIATGSSSAARPGTATSSSAASGSANNRTISIRPSARTPLPGKGGVFAVPAQPGRGKHPVDGCAAWGPAASRRPFPHCNGRVMRREGRPGIITGLLVRLRSQGIWLLRRMFRDGQPHNHARDGRRRRRKRRHDNCSHVRRSGWRGRRGWAIGAGVLGGVAAGALIAGASRPAYGYYARPVYTGPVYGGPAYYDAPACYWVKQRRQTWDGYVVVRRVRVCE